LSAYFEPVIRLAPPSDVGTCVATVRVEIGRIPSEAPPISSGTPIAVDRSGGFLHLDGHVTDSANGRWVWLLPCEVLIRIEGDVVTVWARDEDAARVPVLRIVEDSILDVAQRRGAIVLHSSAVVANGRAVLFCGNKGAGKTTALLRALECTATELLSNDNVCLVETEGCYRARAWPAFLKIEAGTLASTRTLARDLPAAYRGWLGDDTALWDIYEKVALYPAQGAARFGANIVAEAGLGALVLPRFAPDQAPALVPMRSVEIEDELRGSLQGVFNPNHGSWLFPRVDPAQVHRSLDRWLGWLRNGQLPTFGLSWAPSLADLLVRVPALAAVRSVEPALADHWPPLPMAEAPAVITFKSELVRRARD
jgi:hypothetical protein